MIINPSHLRRLLLFAVLVGLGFVGLGVRLYVLQVVRHDKYRDIVWDNTQRMFVKSPRRGDILDVNGQQLATSMPVKRVLADPSLIHPYQAQVARLLSPILSLEEGVLTHQLRLFRTNELGLARTNRFVDLKCRVTHEQWGQITQAMAHLNLGLDESALTRRERATLQQFRRRGIYAEDDYQRMYPSGRLASHVLGYVLEMDRILTNQGARTAVSEITGAAGIEGWLDGKLKGTRGWRVTELDRSQREIVVFREQDVEPRSGLNAVLTVDMYVQSILETHLAEAMRHYSPTSVCGIVMRPRTGEILAMATRPDFEPSMPGKFSEESRRNRVVEDAHEPGSTFKVVVVSGALNEDLVSLNDVFHCENGRWLYNGRLLHDHDRGFANLTVEGIITRSSNIGAAKIAVYRLGAEKLFEYMTQFGFGKRTGITLSGESAGILPAPAKWDGLTISRLPMGHAMAATHLQMVMAMSAIANEGRLMRPMLIHSLIDSTGSVVARFQPQFVRQVISPQAARQMVKALKTVPAKDGTAPKAALDHYTVAGKTGTAQVPGGPSGYLPQKYVSSFIGFFPADDPEICVSVLIEQPDVHKGYYAGQTAAPYFRLIGEQVANHLKIRPDRTDPLVGTSNAVPATAVAARRP